MKFLNNNGFTLIEILVAINLAFISLTFVISFYLFASRLFFFTTKNIDEYSRFNSSLLSFERLLEKSDNYEFIVKNDSAFFFFGGVPRIVFASGTMNLDNVQIVVSPDKYLLNISSDSFSSIIINNGEIKYEGYSGYNGSSKLLPGNIKNIHLQIFTDKRSYELNYSPAEISSEKFINY